MKLRFLPSQTLACLISLASIVHCLGQKVVVLTNDIPRIQADADKGDREAQYRLGIAYSCGIGFQTNYIEAVKWYRKAAEQGQARAQYSMGAACESGLGTGKNQVEAAEWYRKSAQSGVTHAQVRLGLMYQDGRGVAKDQKEATEWLLMAAVEGDPDGQLQVGFLYHDARGYEQAAKWFRKSAEQGNSDAQRILGLYYSQGRGVERDKIEAVKWLNLAADQNDTSAAKERQELFKTMKREEIVEGHNRAVVFTNNLAKAKTGKKESSPSQATEKPKASGSGFLITEDGYLLTNFHVVDGGEKILANINGTNFTARIIKADSANDLAVLKISGNFTALPIVSSRSVKLGDAIFTIGFPNTQMQGVEPKLTDGKISSLSGIRDDARHFQISAPVQPGNSGGALINNAGNVVGVVNARLSDIAMLRATGSLPQNVNYAIKSSYAISFLESIPELADRLKEPLTSKERPFESVVKEAQNAAAMILVY